MARNNTPIIIGAVLFGILALGLTFFVLNSSNSGPAQPTATAQATPAPPRTQWVAQRTIYPRTIITRDMMVESDNSEAAPGAIADPNDAVGLIASRTIRPGEALTASAITTPVARVIPANIPIPVGLRGVAVWVNPDETAASLVDVGDRVDVIASHQLTANKENDRAVIGATEFSTGRTIAQDVEVLAVDPSIQQYTPGKPATVNAAGGTQPAEQPTPVPGATPAAQTPPPSNQQPNQRRFMRVILAATPAVAQRLVAANRGGQLHITIRNPNSHDRLAASEAREYPSRSVFLNTAGRARSEKLQDEARARYYARQDKSLEFQQEKQLKTLSVAPAIPNPSGIGSTGNNMQPSYNKEVTVIRGTEKTRVIVPR
jgi:Flp pilus assembly protein CpaB